MGVKEFGEFLRVIPRHVRRMLGSDVWGPQYALDANCAIAFVHVPRSRFSVLAIDALDFEVDLDRLGRNEPFVCSPATRAYKRLAGGPWVFHYHDESRIIPNWLHGPLRVEKGVFELRQVTRARMVPVCWNIEMLAAWEKVRKKDIVRTRSLVKRRPTDIHRNFDADGAKGGLYLAALYSKVFDSETIPGIHLDRREHLIN